MRIVVWCSSLVLCNVYDRLSCFFACPHACGVMNIILTNAKGKEGVQQCKKGEEGADKRNVGKIISLHGQG